MKKHDSYAARMNGEKAHSKAHRSKSNVGWIICSFVLLLFSVSTGIFALMAYVEHEDNTTQLDSLRNQIFERDTEISDLRQQKNDLEARVSNTTQSAHSLRLVKYGIKIKLPDKNTFKTFSYQYDEVNNVITFWALPSSIKTETVPEFADLTKNNKTPNARLRILDKEELAKCDKCQNVVYSSGEYSVVYSHYQSLYSKADDEEGVKQETSAVNTLQTWLTDKSNYEKL